MPVAQFAAPTTMIDPTKVADANVAPEETPEPDALLGEQAYTRLCTECHGDKGEGVIDQGDAIAGTVNDPAKLTDLLRTGGDLGSEHLFGPTKISDDGIDALYTYIQTFPTP